MQYLIRGVIILIVLGALWFLDAVFGIFDFVRDRQDEGRGH